MKIRLKTEELKYLYYTPIEEIRGKQSFSKIIVEKYKEKVDILLSIKKLSDLNDYGGLNF